MPLYGDRLKACRVWQDMHRRCKNPVREDYKWYGARGIAVCARWEKLQNFIDDMGFPPPGKSIDRVDPNGNYEPANCRWATPKEQTANRRPPAEHLRSKDGYRDKYGLRNLRIGDVTVIPFIKTTEVRGSADYLKRRHGRRFHINQLPNNHYQVTSTA